MRVIPLVLSAVEGNPLASSERDVRDLFFLLAL
jgi:hypothetical protein